jgi:hypothetical protein
MMALYSIPFHDFLHDGPCQRFSFWRKSHGTLKTGWSISGGKGCHLLQKEVFRQKEKRWPLRTYYRADRQEEKFKCSLSS